MDVNLLNDSFNTCIILCKDMSASEIKRLVRQEFICNQALSNWIAKTIDDDTFLDILEANGHKMDEYIRTVNSNLDYLGV